MMILKQNKLCFSAIHTRCYMLADSVEQLSLLELRQLIYRNIIYRSAIINWFYFRIRPGDRLLGLLYRNSQCSH